MTLCAQLIEGLPVSCATCGRGLCLRQQVLNMALGEDTDLLCLACLGEDNGKSRRDILRDVGDYVLSRQCFAKEWVKYKDVSQCPFPDTCLPADCFSKMPPTAEDISQNHG